MYILNAQLGKTNDTRLSTGVKCVQTQLTFSNILAHDPSRFQLA